MSQSLTVLRFLINEVRTTMKNSLSRRDFLVRSTQSSAIVSTAAAALAGGQTFAATGRPKIKMGQIGVGHAHAKGKMAAFRKSPDFEVVGVVESDEQRRQDAMKDEVYQGLRWMTQEELLNTPGLQAVAVETEVEHLLDAAETCVQAGLNVHLDKPAGRSLAQFRRILELADRQRLTLQMGYMYRYNPAVLLLKDLLRKGWLGEVFELHAVMSKVVNPKKRRRWAEHPGGVMFELGCHLVDLMVGVLGRPSEVTPFNQHVAKIDDGLVDNMLAVCTYPRALASLKSSAMEVEGFDRRHFVVCGSEGTLHIQPLDAPNVRLALSKPRGSYRAEYQEIPFGPYDRYVADIADLAQIIRGEKASDYNSEHDLAVQETLLQACELGV